MPIQQLSDTNKRYITLASCNTIFLLIFYLISQPNSDLTSISNDSCNFTMSVNKTDYNDTHNYTLIYCNCDIAISSITTFRITYNIIGMLCMIFLILTIYFQNSPVCFIKLSSLSVCVFYVVNLIFSNTVLYHLNGFSSYCYVGLLNTSYYFLINYIVNFWLIIIIIVGTLFYGVLILARYYGCFTCSNLITYPQQQENQQNQQNNQQDNSETLPLYQERDINLPTYQEAMCIKYVAYNTLSYEVHEYETQ